MILGLLLFLPACAKKPPKKPKRPTISIPSKPPPSSLPDSLTPKREASQRIVQVGKEYLDSGEAGKAVHTFQEAVNVDPENGVAWFYLALGLYRTDSFEEAIGLLDRADTLLAPYPEWHQEVEKLRVLVEQGKEGTIEKKPKEKKGYY